MTWGTGGEPKFTPILTEGFDEIIGRAKSLELSNHNAALGEI